MAAAAAVAQAAVVALAQAKADFEHVLNHVCGLTQLQRNTLINDGYDTADSVKHWKFNRIRDWAEKKASLAAAAGRCTFGDRKIKCIQGLSYWCTKTSLMGIGLVNIVNAFDIAVMNDSITEAELEYEDSKKDSDIDKPEKFSYEKWNQWEESVYNYFTAEKNSLGVPYAYIIRKDPCPLEPGQMEEVDHIIYNASLTGPMFKRDSVKVLSILREITLGTQAETWMKGKRCGRAAMLALQAHYDGVAESDRRLTVSKADLGKLFYRNESTFSFEKYVTKLLDIFNIHELYGVPLYEKDKVDHLFNKINCPDKEFQMAVSIARSNHNKTFVDASTYLQTEVSRIFPESQPGSGRYKTRRYIKGMGRGRGGYRGGGRFGRGYGGRGRGGGRGYYNKSKKEENGVDISDPTRWYSNDELDALTPDTRRGILTHKDRPAAIAERKRKRAERNTSSADTSNRERADLINSLMNATRNAAAANTVQPGTVRYPQNGSRNTAATNRNPPAQVSTNGSDSLAGSVLTFDHNGNIVE